MNYLLSADNDYNFRVSEKFPFKWMNETVSFFASGGESGNSIDVEWNKVRDKMIIKYCGYIAYLYRKLWIFIKNIK